MCVCVGAHRYVLGIVDKRSNTIELHECPQQIITMQQEVKGIDRQVEDHTHVWRSLLLAR